MQGRGGGKRAASHNVTDDSIENVDSSFELGPFQPRPSAGVSRSGTAATVRGEGGAGGALSRQSSFSSQQVHCVIDDDDDGEEGLVLEPLPSSSAVSRTASAATAGGTKQQRGLDGLPRTSSTNTAVGGGGGELTMPAAGGSAYRAGAAAASTAAAPKKTASAMAKAAAAEQKKLQKAEEKERKEQLKELEKVKKKQEKKQHQAERGVFAREELFLQLDPSLAASEEAQRWKAESLAAVDPKLQEYAQKLLEGNSKPHGVPGTLYWRRKVYNARTGSFELPEEQAQGLSLRGDGGADADADPYDVPAEGFVIKFYPGERQGGREEGRRRRGALGGGS